MIIEKTDNNFLKIKSQYVEELLNNSPSTYFSLRVKYNNSIEHLKEFEFKDFYSIDIKEQAIQSEVLLFIRTLNITTGKIFDIPINLDIVLNQSIGNEIVANIIGFFDDKGIEVACYIEEEDGILKIYNIPNDFVFQEFIFTNKTKELLYGDYKDIFFKGFDLYIKPSFLALDSFVDGIYYINFTISDSYTFTTEESCLFYDNTIKERLSKNIKSLFEDAYYIGIKENFGLHLMLLHYGLSIGQNNGNNYQDMLEVYNELITELAICENKRV